MNNNINLLKQNYPNIHKDIIKIFPNKNTYEIIKTKTRESTLKINDKDKFYFLHSKYNPNREGKNIAEENYDESIENYIIFGLGFGYHVEKLMDMAPNANFYIIETNKEIFRLALDNVDLNNILKDSRVRLCVTDNMDEISQILNEALTEENIKIVLHNPSFRIMSENLQELKYLLEEFKMTERSIEKYSPLLDENFKSNIKNFNDNVDILFNKYKNKPLYIISAGPSLDKNIRELKKVKDNGIILSVGRAVRPLLKENIVPDYIIITDPASYLYNMQLGGLEINVPIIVLSTCDKNVMLSYKGQKLITLQGGYTPAEEYAKLNNHKLVQTGGSVATTALDVAINMGCNPIIFVGQDLAYTDGKSHSKDTFSKNMDSSKNLREVEDVYGNRIYAPKNLYSYLRWIQNRIKLEKDIVFIDATEGGARIKGTGIMKLADVVKKY